MAAPPGLRCNRCERVQRPAGYVLECCPDGLLIGDYPRELTVREDQQGLWRFTDWLPVEAPGDQPVGGVTYRSEALGDALGLDQLWVSFNGYWPEMGAGCPTCSFKDLEVAPTFQRLVERGATGVVVASAGNTGRSFAAVGSRVSFPVVVIVAEQHLERLWCPGRPHGPTTLVIGLQDADYNDAIDVAGEVAARVDFELEGGVKNVARRDGIGTLLLDAAEVVGRLPDHYVQAVGGGPGPIGVGGMAERLLATGARGDRLPRFHLAQDAAHHPVHTAWTAGRDRLSPDDVPPTPGTLYADVLLNRSPAYEVRGGLWDLLTASDGRTYAVGHDEARAARDLFESTEGVDVMEAPAVALGALHQAVAAGAVGRDDVVLLGVTGGGVERLRQDVELHPARPDLLTSRAPATDAIVDLVEGALVGV